MRRLALGALAALLAAMPAAAQRAVDVVHYDFELTLPDTGSVIRGSATLTVAKRRGPATLAIDLLLPIDSVMIAGRRVPFVAREGGADVPLDPDADTARVMVDYHGSPTDGLIISRDAAGRWQAFGDNWPNRGRHWLPLVDRPDDKATVSWNVDAPWKLAVVANGRRVVGPPHKGWSTTRSETRWVETHPIPTYLMVLAAAEMRADTLRDTLGVRQLVWRSPDVARTPPAFVEAPAIVGFYSALVAPFPYERLDHVQSSTRFGGMENATAIFYADGAFRQGTMSVGLIAHETAHQWFGDAVTERDWAHLWLSEGFATYFAQLYAEHSRGRDTLVAGMRAIRTQILGDRDAVPKRPVIDTIETDPLALLNANSYQKGGFVLHMARRLIGDSAFFQGIRAYYQAHRDGNATTDDLQRALEVSSGRDLGWFFDQWLRRPGYPEVGVSWSYDRRARRVYLEVSQRPRFGSYRFPLVVQVLVNDGSTVRATVEVPAQRRSLVMIPIDLGTEPAGIRLDPDADLLAAIDPPRKLRRR